MTTVQKATIVAPEGQVRPSLFVDSDSHIEEHEGVFDYLDEEFAHRRPVVVDIPGVVKHRPSRDKVWLIDGEMRPKLFGRNPSCYATPPTSQFAKQKPVSVAVQGITDVDEYVASMDTIALDVTVVYPTLFLHPVTSDPRFENALLRSWNTYMAETCSKRPDRLKFGALVPMLDPVAAAAEVRRAKDLGASSVMVLPVVGSTFLHDRRFDVVYESLIDNGLPLAVHVGWAHRGINDNCDSLAAAMVLNFELSMCMGLFSFLAGGILDRYPELTVGFFEAGATWLPTIMDRIEKWRPTPTAEMWPAARSPQEYIRDCDVFFTVEGDEGDLPGFVQLVGEHRILGSGDFPHVHYAGAQLGRTLDHLRNHPSLSNHQKELLLGLNAKGFYRFD